jgi:hypothetical protein
LRQTFAPDQNLGRSGRNCCRESLLFTKNWADGASERNNKNKNEMKNKDEMKIKINGNDNRFQGGEKNK